MRFMKRNDSYCCDKLLCLQRIDDPQINCDLPHICGYTLLISVINCHGWKRSYDVDDVIGKFCVGVKCFKFK